MARQKGLTDFNKAIIHDARIAQELTVAELARIVNYSQSPAPVKNALKYF